MGQGTALCLPVMLSCQGRGEKAKSPFWVERNQVMWCPAYHRLPYIIVPVISQSIVIFTTVEPLAIMHA